MQEYEAGRPCKLLRQLIPFIPDDSRGVLDHVVLFDRNWADTAFENKVNMYGVAKEAQDFLHL